MRVLTSSVLIMEAIVLLLAIPVALMVDDRPGWVAWVLVALALMCLLLPGLFNRPYFLPVGWALQVAVILAGFAAPMLFGLGAVFAALWWTAVHLGRKADAGRPAPH